MHIIYNETSKTGTLNLKKPYLLFGYEIMDVGMRLLMLQIWYSTMLSSIIGKKK